MKVGVSKVRRIGQPSSPAVRAYELGREVHKISLLPKVPHIRYECPRTSEVTTFKDEGVKFGNGVSAIGDGHQVLLQRRIVSDCHISHSAFPSQQGLNPAEVFCPNCLSLQVVATEEFICARPVQIGRASCRERVQISMVASA